MKKENYSKLQECPQRVNFLYYAFCGFKIAQPSIKSTCSFFTVLENQTTFHSFFNQKLLITI